MAKVQAINHYPLVRENLLAIEQETVVDMLLSLDAKYQQLGDYVRDFVNQKYGQKNERFAGEGQLLLFPSPEEKPSEIEPTSESEDKNANGKTVKKKNSGHTRNQFPSELRECQS